MREIARQLGRSPSTISRELRRNAATRCGRLDYRATTAQWHADLRARRPKPAKLAANDDCGPMSRIVWPGWCSVPTGSRLTVLQCPGVAAVTAGARTGAGRGRGVRSRSLTGWVWTSPMMTRCACLMRRSTSRCSCKDAARYWGKQLYLRRQGSVEPVFGQIKSNRGADRFRRRGRSAVRSEWRLLTATHNLLKLHRHQLATA